MHKTDLQMLEASFLPDFSWSCLFDSRQELNRKHGGQKTGARSGTCEKVHSHPSPLTLGEEGYRSDFIKGLKMSWPNGLWSSTSGEELSGEEPSFCEVKSLRSAR